MRYYIYYYGLCKAFDHIDPHTLLGKLEALDKMIIDLFTETIYRYTNNDVATVVTLNISHYMIELTFALSFSAGYDREAQMHCGWTDIRNNNEGIL